jgi:secondary thiamine-phosphate synthase enzyme
MKNPADTNNPARPGMRQATTTLSIVTRGRGLIELTREVRAWVRASGIQTGLLTLFIRHTSASLLIQENADPSVLDDLERFFARLVRDGDPLFEHTAEGVDDMPAHVRAALTQTHLSIPVADGAPTLGTWQGIFVYEHRHRGQTRDVVLHLAGEP